MMRDKRLLKIVCKDAKKILNKTLSLPAHHNTKYSQADIMDVLINGALKRKCTETAALSLKSIRGNSPSADAVLRRIAKLDIDQAQHTLYRTHSHIFRKAKSFGAFRKPLDIAIDATDLPYYGDKNDPWVVGGKPKAGTARFRRYCTASIVNRGQRFHLVTKPMHQIDSNQNMLNECLIYAKKKVKIGTVLADRGFFSVKAINHFHKHGVNFIMPAVRNDLIGKLLRRTKKFPKTFPYTLTTHNGVTARFNLIFYEDEDGRKFAFATNIPVNENSVQDIRTRYSARWSIETAFRDVKTCLPRTTSKNPVIRIFYYLLGTVLRNLWVLANMTAGLIQKMPIVIKPIITIDTFVSKLLQLHARPKKPPES